jgi:hypothetical protein
LLHCFEFSISKSSSSYFYDTSAYIALSSEIANNQTNKTDEEASIRKKSEQKQQNADQTQRQPEQAPAQFKRALCPAPHTQPARLSHLRHIARLRQAIAQENRPLRLPRQVEPLEQRTAALTNKLTFP